MPRFSYCVEILVAELIFLHGFPKRKLFPLRLAAGVFLILVWSFFSFSPNRLQQPMLVFFVMFSLMAVSIMAMYLSFALPFPQVLSACVAGFAIQHIGYHLFRIATAFPLLNLKEQVSVYAEMGMVFCFYLIFYVAGGWRLTRLDYYREYDRVTGIIAVVNVFICIGISRFLRMGGEMNSYAIVSTSLYAITCCVLALFVQYALRGLVRVRSEYLAYRRLAKTELLQYETSRENAQMLAMKYHDLKHKLVSIEHSLPREEIDSMRELLEEYDSTYHTGLDTLDIILNEKSLLCRAKKVTLTVMGNGAVLSFMKPMDVYALFGNILENAMEAVENLEPVQRRQVSIILENHGDLVYLNCTNYTGQELSLGRDGLPQTSKEEQPLLHGFGLRSVKAIAEKYGGGISIHSGEGLFSLSIYLSPEGREAPGQEE